MSKIALEPVDVKHGQVKCTFFHLEKNTVFSIKTLKEIDVVLTFARAFFLVKREKKKS